MSQVDADVLNDDSPEAWERIVDSLGPASMLVCIRDRMSDPLLADLSPEDIWQETLLHVWRDRSKHDWRGMRSFRQWVLRIAENRILNAVDTIQTLKRGGDKARVELPSESGLVPPPMVDSMTPSRIASAREQADAMRTALESLPEELIEVVRLRLFEETPVLEVAERLGIGESAVKHRFRKGAALYAQSLQRATSHG